MTPLVYFYCLYVSAKTSVITLALALLLSIMMVLASVSALAAGDGDTPAATTTKGSITVHKSLTVPLTNKTLSAYKILDATYSGTGTSQAVSYTVPASLKTWYNTYTPFQAEGKDVEQQLALAANKGKTFDQLIVEKIAALSAAQLKDFEYAALDAATAANIEPIAGTADGEDVKFTNLDAGYYVIKDNGTGKPISALMLDTVTNAEVEITLKAEDKTTKKVKTAGELANEKANELGIGRVVNYEVTQEIPDTTGFDYYYFMFNDTMSSGLTFDPASVVIKVTGDAIADDPDTDANEAVAARDLTLVKAATGVENPDYYLYADKTADAAVLNGKTFIIAFDDVVKGVNSKKYVPGDQITITYSATVNSSAITGINPNTNDVQVEFSNNPDKDQKDHKTNYPGIPASQTTNPTGVGPDKFTDTYTTKLTVLKYDASTQTKTVLPGVEFTLTGTSKDAVFNAEEVFEIDPAGDYWLLTDGTYTPTAPATVPTLSETTGGAGWVKLEANEVVAEGTAVRTVGGDKLRPYVPATDSAKTRYIINETNVDKYTSTTTKYSKSTKTSDAAESYQVTRSGVTGDDGKLAFSQLGAGSYKLSETGILPGFNGVADITFDITCTLPAAANVIAGTETATWAVTNVQNGEITYDAEKGEFSITIDNKKGTELPSTGGIGTTIFYVAGSILVLAAAILLITKRRMGAED